MKIYCIYAPKYDQYHREKWREPYPDDKKIELKNLVDIAIKNNVHFIFAISPGLDLNYEGEKSEEDFQYTINDSSVPSLNSKIFTIIS